MIFQESSLSLKVFINVSSQHPSVVAKASINEEEFVAIMLTEWFSRSLIKRVGSEEISNYN